MSVGTSLNLTFYPVSDAAAMSDPGVNDAADELVQEGCEGSEAISAVAPSSEYALASKVESCSGRGDVAIEGIYPWAFGGTRFMSATGIPIEPSGTHEDASPSATDAFTTAIVPAQRKEALVVRSSGLSPIIYQGAEYQNLDALVGREAAKRKLVKYTVGGGLTLAVGIPTIVYGPGGGLVAFAILIGLFLLYGLGKLFESAEEIGSGVIRETLTGLTGRLSQREAYEWYDSVKLYADPYRFRGCSVVQLMEDFQRAFAMGSRVVSEEDGRVYDFRKLMGPQMLAPFVDSAAQSPMNARLLQIIAEHNELANSAEFIAPIKLDWHPKWIDADGIEEMVEWFAKRGNSSVIAWLLTLVEAKNEKARRLLDNMQSEMGKERVRILIEEQTRFRIEPQGQKVRVGAPYREVDAADEPVVVSRDAKVG